MVELKVLGKKVFCFGGQSLLDLILKYSVSYQPMALLKYQSHDMLGDAPNGGKA